MKKNSTYYVLTIIGLILLAAGLYLIKNSAEPQGVMIALPYILVGLGCGVFGHGTGELISRRALKNSPDLAKKIMIEQNDERNIALVNRAKGKAYDLMVPVFGSLMIAFALMGVDLIALLLLVAAYLFICGSSVYYRIRYEKEM